MRRWCLYNEDWLDCFAWLLWSSSCCDYVIITMINNQTSHFFYPHVAPFISIDRSELDWKKDIFFTRSDYCHKSPRKIWASEESATMMFLWLLLITRGDAPLPPGSTFYSPHVFLSVSQTLGPTEETGEISGWKTSVRLSDFLYFSWGKLSCQNRI